MPKEGLCASVFMGCLILVQIGLIMWVQMSNRIMKDEWTLIFGGDAPYMEHFDAHIDLIEIERFWGPVNGIFPKDCNSVDTIDDINDGSLHKPYDTLCFPQTGGFCNTAPCDGRRKANCTKNKYHVKECLCTTPNTCAYEGVCVERKSWQVDPESTKCIELTGGTCNMKPCDSSRNATCKLSYSGHNCVCGPGTCVRGGKCVAQSEFVHTRPKKSLVDTITKGDAHNAMNFNEELGEKADAIDATRGKSAKERSARRKQSSESTDESKTHESEEKKSVEKRASSSDDSQIKIDSEKRSAISTSDSKKRAEESSSTPDYKETELQTSATSKRLRRLEDRRLSWPPIKITMCNKTSKFAAPGYWNRYFAMITFSRLAGWQANTMEALYDKRLDSFNEMMYALVACMVLKYSLKVTDFVTKCFGHKYVQLWNSGRTTFDKGLEAVMLHGVSIVFTVALQMCMCTIFLTFWREDHFVMTFIPRVGFTFFFWSLAAFTIGMTIDRVMGVMMQCGDWFIYTFWIVWGIWMLFITIPMIGYSIYSLNFIWRVQMDGWVDNEHTIFSDRYRDAGISAGRAAFGFVIVSIVDLIFIIATDMEIL